MKFEYLLRNVINIVYTDNDESCVIRNTAEELLNQTFFIHAARNRLVENSYKQNSVFV